MLSRLCRHLNASAHAGRDNTGAFKDFFSGLSKIEAMVVRPALKREQPEVRIKSTFLLDAFCDYFPVFPIEAGNKQPLALIIVLQE